MYICSQCKQIVGAENAFCPHDGAKVDQVKEAPPGARLGQYVMVKKLGEGGMGYVFEAKHETLNRRTAIKFLLPQFATNQVVVTRFLQEAKSVNLINHENIINVYDYGTAPDQSVYFVMEYLEGEAFNDFLKRIGKLKPNALFPIFLPMFRALAAAHEKEIIHRDLKPANIFLQRREGNPYFVKLLDFGIAKLRGEGAVEGLTKQGALLGTPQFMSPEQVNGVAVDARSDLFSMGVILYRAAAGKLPFQGKGFAAVAEQILMENPAPPTQVNPEVPPKLETIILKCLEKEREKRYHSARDIIRDLEALRDELGFSADAVPFIEGDDINKPPPPREAKPSGSKTVGSMSDASLAAFEGEGKTNDLNPATVQSTAASQQMTAVVAPAPVPAPSRAPLAIGGVLALVLGVGGVFLLGGKKNEPAPAPPATAPAPAPTKTLKELAELNDLGGLRSKVQEKLDEALGSEDSQLALVDALSVVGGQKGIQSLYKLLKSESPEVRKKAAYALRDLKIPEAAPKIRDAFSNADKGTKVHLAACMFALGDGEAKPILQKELSATTSARLIAALALAQAGEKATTEPILREFYTNNPKGGAFWLLAAEGLLALGDAEVKAALNAERANPDPKIALAVLGLLAAQGDGEAKAAMVRLLDDPEYPRLMEAALALAKLGDPAGLSLAKSKLSAVDPADRAAAVAVLGRFPAAANARDEFVRAAEDKDAGVSLTALAALLALP